MSSKKESKEAWTVSVKVNEADFERGITPVVLVLVVFVYAGSWGFVASCLVSGFTCALSGVLCGCMQAFNIPRATTPVSTFWEGEIIDYRVHSFVTSRWDASLNTDLTHWCMFRGNHEPPLPPPLPPGIDSQTPHHLVLHRYTLRNMT